MAEQKQLIPGNTELYTAKDCDDNFIKRNGTTSVTNFTLNGDVTLNRNLKLEGAYDLDLGKYVNIISPAGRQNAVNLIVNGSEWDTMEGPGLSLCPASHTNAPGYFKLQARTSPTKYVELRGTPDGKLLWGGKNIVRSVNGTPAGEEGNISITHVESATNATNATTADRATKDGSGNVITSTYVKLTGNQTISGTKTFNTSPTIPKPDANSDTNIPASTNWVNDKFKKFKNGPATWTKLVNKESFNWWDDNDFKTDKIIKLSESCFNFDYLVVCLDSNDSTPANSHYLNWFPNFILRCSATSPNTDMAGDTNKRYRILRANGPGSYRVYFRISGNGTQILKPGIGDDSDYENSICTGIYGVNVY